MINERKAAANRRLAKKRVQCLNEVLCFVSSSVLADSFVLRNPLLRQAPKRYRIWSMKFTVPKNGVSNSPSGRLKD